MTRFFVLLAVLGLGWTLPVMAQVRGAGTIIPLYDGPAPALVPNPVPESFDTVFDHPVLRNVTTPTLTRFVADPAKATGAAVVIAPGGGNMWLAIDNEGYDVARWLASEGIEAFVLKYRIRPTQADPKSLGAQLRAAGPQSAAMRAPAEWTSGIADAAAAIRLVRKHAGEWRLDPQRIGLLGFSAGAHNALEVVTGADRSALPDFVGLLYGPVQARPVSSDVPPLFAAVAADDPLVPPKDLGLIANWLAAGRPVEFHLYQGGKHGFGMETRGTTSDLWAGQFLAWMRALGLLTPVHSK